MNALRQRFLTMDNIDAASIASANAADDVPQQRTTTTDMDTTDTYNNGYTILNHPPEYANVQNNTSIESSPVLSLNPDDASYPTIVDDLSPINLSPNRDNLEVETVLSDDQGNIKIENLKAIVGPNLNNKQDPLQVQEPNQAPQGVLPGPNNRGGPSDLSANLSQPTEGGKAVLQGQSQVAGPTSGTSNGSNNVSPQDNHDKEKVGRKAIMLLGTALFVAMLSGAVFGVQALLFRPTSSPTTTQFPTIVGGQPPRPPTSSPTKNNTSLPPFNKPHYRAPDSVDEGTIDLDEEPGTNEDDGDTSRDDAPPNPDDKPDKWFSNFFRGIFNSLIQICFGGSTGSPFFNIPLGCQGWHCRTGEDFFIKGMMDKLSKLMSSVLMFLVSLFVQGLVAFVAVRNFVPFLFRCVRSYLFGSRTAGPIRNHQELCHLFGACKRALSYTGRSYPRTRSARGVNDSAYDKLSKKDLIYLGGRLQIQLSSSDSKDSMVTEIIGRYTIFLNKCTVPQLVEVMGARGVRAPPNAKKRTLIELLVEKGF